MRKLFILLCLISFYSVGLAQNKSTLSGYLKDAETGEALIGARVYVDTLKAGVVANDYGFYSITLPNGTYAILFSFVGKSPEKMLVQLDANLTLNVNLKESKMLNTVEVTGEAKQHESSEMSTFNLPMSKVKSLPVMFGEQDILKTLQLLPGVRSGSEGSSGIYVRGGGPDQNLIMLDGVPIYNANHLFGFFSVFNGDAINNVKLIKGGFPAEYGGRISSVIDIRMKEGDMKKIHGEGSIGLIASKFMLNGPIWKDRTSFMISGRRTYFDILSKPFIALANKQMGGEDKISGGYYFYDLNLKVNHIINEKNRIYLSGYMGDDVLKVTSRYTIDDGSGKKYFEESEGGMDWGNKIVALRWNHQFNPKLFLNVTGNFSEYKFNTGFGYKYYEQGKEKTPEEKYAFNYLSGITDFGGNLHFSYYPHPKHKIKFGVGETYHTFKPGVTTLNYSSSGDVIDTSFGASKTFAHEFFGFLQDDFELGKRIQANVGVHFSNFLVRQKYYNAIQPRASFNFKITDKSSIKASYARTTQFLHLLTNASIGLPTDLWVPVTDSVPPQYGHQWAIGYAREFKHGFRASTEAYYKVMNNLLEYKDGASYFGTTESWEELIEVGNGNSYGLEVLLERTTGKLTGWIGYTLSWTNRHFDNLNNGKWFPYRYDRRHDVSVVLTYKFNDKVDIGVVWVYGTGNAVTLALQQYNGMPVNEWGNQTINHIDQRNNYRMPSYHRLDLGLNIHRPHDKWEGTWSISIYNAYSRQNPFYLEIGYLPNDPTDKKVLKQISLFPIIPTVSYSFKF